jgi:uroporphyrinogen decarboxylase
MTPRERWLALFRGTRPDRVPCDYWGTSETTNRLLQHLNCRNERELWEKLEIDKCIHLAARHPRAIETTWHTPSLFSLWGIPVKTVDYGHGVYEEAINPPLAEVETPSDLQSWSWPDLDAWDTSGLVAQIKEWEDYPILGTAFEPFYLYCRLRGMERALEDLLIRPELVDALLEIIFEIHAAVARRSLEAAGGRIDFVYVAEDLGTQESLLMSPAAFRRFLKPWLGRMMDLAHRYEAYVFHHDDGAIRPLIPELVEMGVDLLNPIQWRCNGMARDGLARDFGADLVFHGGLDNQHTLPFGTPEDVRTEVRENLAIFRDCKGYIVAPCHNLQSNTPTENIVALYRAVRDFG